MRTRKLQEGRKNDSLKQEISKHLELRKIWVWGAVNVNSKNLHLLISQNSVDRPNLGQMHKLSYGRVMLFLMPNSCKKDTSLKPWRYCKSCNMDKRAVVANNKAFECGSVMSFIHSAVVPLNVII